MITTGVISQSKPETMLYSLRKDGSAEVWLRKNIKQTTMPASALSDEGDGDNLIWMYDEAYFRTNAPREEVEADAEKFWTIGCDWSVEVPLTADQKIAELQEQLKRANADLEKSRLDSDMAIAELTMVMAAMMGGEGA